MASLYFLFRLQLIIVLLGDRGSYITLVGLFSNIGLTAVKGLAGWYMHSASLLADAGHSMSGSLRLPRNRESESFILL